MVDEPILAVNAFEKVMAQAHRFVKHYHTGNGVFAHKGFLDEVNRKDQKITFCAVGAHHQNGIIENKNKMLTLSAQTLLCTGSECGLKWNRTEQLTKLGNVLFLPRPF
jgi:hypothetical protein